MDKIKAFVEVEFEPNFELSFEQFQVYKTDVKFMSMACQYLHDKSGKRLNEQLKQAIADGFLIPLSADILTKFLAMCFLKSGQLTSDLSIFIQNWRKTIKLQYKALSASNSGNSQLKQKVLESMKTSIAVLQHVQIIIKLNDVMSSQRNPSGSGLGSILTGTASTKATKPVGVDEVFICQFLRNVKDNGLREDALTPLYLHLKLFHGQLHMFMLQYFRTLIIKLYRYNKNTN